MLITTINNLNINLYSALNSEIIHISRWWNLGSFLLRRFTAGLQLTRCTLQITCLDTNLRHFINQFSSSSHKYYHPFRQKTVASHKCNRHSPEPHQKLSPHCTLKMQLQKKEMEKIRKKRKRVTLEYRQSRRTSKN